MPVYKIHRLRPDPTATSTTWRETLCGLKGISAGWPDEFDTADCERFEAKEIPRGVTCKRCLKHKDNV